MNPESPTRRHLHWVILASGLALALCGLCALAALAVDVRAASPGDRATMLSACAAGTLSPELRLAVSWQASRVAAGRSEASVRAYPHIICARVPGVGGLRSRGLLVYPPQD